MSIEVPAEALEGIQARLAHIDASMSDATSIVFRIGHVRKLAAFADHFARHPLPGMQFSHIVGSESALHINEPSLPMIDLVKINGRNFVPEVAEAVDMHIATPVEIYREMLAECSVRFREYEASHREKAKAASKIVVGVEDLARKVSYDQAIDKAERNAAIARRIEGILSDLDAPELPADVRALVIAGRELFGQIDAGGYSLGDGAFPLREEADFVAFDKALEAFSARVPYDGEPEISGMVASNNGVTDFAVAIDEWWKGPGWGDPVTVTGQPPEWMKDEGRCWAQAGDLSEGATNCTHTYFLPADHPYYLATSRGFTYWPGGDNPPVDWDSSREVLMDDDIASAIRFGDRWDWRKDPAFGKVRIIGYHKRPAAETVPTQGVNIVSPEDVANLETEVSIGDKIRGSFEDRMRTQKIDAFAAAALTGILSHDTAYGPSYQGAEHLISGYAFDFAFAMMAERERRGLK